MMFLLSRFRSFNVVVVLFIASSFINFRPRQQDDDENDDDAIATTTDGLLLVPSDDDDDEEEEEEDKLAVLAMKAALPDVGIATSIMFVRKRYQNANEFPGKK